LLALHGKSLLCVAARSILHGLEQGTPLLIDPATYPADLAAQGACFVTLKKSGALRGCIGSSIAHRPLIVDTALNGFAAAFKDPRFANLTHEEIADLLLSISVLATPQAMTIKDEKDLLAQLRPNIDGLIIVNQSKRALFLPSVWESLPHAEEFLMRLKEKAGMPPDHWSATFQALRFTAQELSADELDDPNVIWQPAAADA
jgi:AmmeMemoRadiSam system protein A